MDTKWKKSKMIVAVVSHVLGVSLFLSALFLNPFVLFGDALPDMGALLSPDGRYEQTQDFRDYVSRMTNNLLCVGAGRPISFAGEEYTRRAGWFPWLFGSATDTAITVTVPAEISQYEEMEAEAIAGEEELVEEGEASAGASWNQSAPKESFWQESEGDWSPKELEEMYEWFFKNHEKDKNLLYRVSCTDAEGKECVYTNAEEAFGKENSPLPEGYSFLLKFEGDRAAAWLDGEELDLYGDGIYRWDDTQWAIPGYENYKLGEDFRRSQVTVAVRRVPMRYAVGDTVYGGGLYWAQQSFAARKRALALWGIIFAITVLLLAVCFLWRRERREACRRLGRALGKLYVECVLLLVAALIWMIVLSGILRPLFWMWESIIWWGSGIDWLGLTGGILACFWLFYLVYLYVRYGEKPWKRSLCGKLIRFLGKKERRLEIQERMNRRMLRCIVCLAVGLMLAAIGGLLPWRMTVACWDVAAPVLTAGLAFLVYDIYCRCRLSRDLGLLNDQIHAAWEGKERSAYALPVDSDLADMAQKVAGIRDGLETAVEERMKSERMKVELVANVSHDIKTPLTSIISYVDLLKEDDSLPAELKDYVAILAQKSERLKEMVQDVFEVSKASSGQLPVSRERLDLAKLLRQTMADMQEQIADAPVSLKAQIPEEAVEIVADGQRLYRVFQNLLQNALQYSLEGSRVYIRLEKEGSLAVVSVRNTSRNELDGGTDFTERFVRGDVSRTDGGSGLGLSIAKSFTEACGGAFAVETIADLFVVTVRFETA